MANSSLQWSLENRNFVGVTAAFPKTTAGSAVTVGVLPFKASCDFRTYSAIKSHLFGVFGGECFSASTNAATAVKGTSKQETILVSTLYYNMNSKLPTVTVRSVTFKLLSS